MGKVAKEYAGVSHLNEEVRNAMRRIPAMGALLALPWIADYEEEIGRETVKSVIASVLDRQREVITKNPDTAFTAESIERTARAELEKKSRSTLRRVVNATGVVIHTNLGRSLLAREAVLAAQNVAAHYSTLEYSVETGSRGHRNDHIEWLVCRLTGAEAALVVNNNAAAVILSLMALAKDKETIISRGELVEIGGSFRIPDIMALSGTRMVGVGTTNRTHLKDYSEALAEDTAMLLKVHPSNYRITGFTSVVPREELSALAREKGLIFMEDLGSGMLVDTSSIGLNDDPTVRECLAAGADLVTFSGDKLLGGPQIGVIVGSAELISKLRVYPLLRAMRVDKMTLAAFEATLRLYLKGEISSIPTLAMVFRNAEGLKRQARNFARRLKKLFRNSNFRSVEIAARQVLDTVGGGAFPQSELVGWAVAVRLPEIGNASKLADKLRAASVPIIAAASADRLLLHMRTITMEDEKLILAAFREMLF